MSVIHVHWVGAAPREEETGAWIWAAVAYPTRGHSDRCAGRGSIMSRYKLAYFIQKGS